jgi:hypothetical protein
MRLATVLRTALTSLGLILIAGSSGCAAGGFDEDTLRVHEWGTFTALQNEHGEALPGINIDDEPLPAFSHNLRPWAVVPARAVPRPQMKGAPEVHPSVTLRLETPVIYFHPPTDEKLPFDVDVDVRFRAGWLTEFYPHANPDAPGLKEDEFHFGPITPGTIGRLTWRNVQVGTDASGPPATENVWLAPRNVRAAAVTVPPQTNKDEGPESERFLFYRGVANRPAPLRISQDLASGSLFIRSQCADVFAAGQSARIGSLWLVDIRRDGSVAFRTLDPITVSPDASTVLASPSSKFPEAQYAPGNLDVLRDRMHTALMGEGLYADEATAMLSTWKRAYFQSPGLRLFFLVPRAWTDAVLPLKLSRPAEVQRVMMGRIELITGEQRRLLKLLSTTPASDGKWIDALPDSPAARKFREGRSDYGDLGVKIPADYQAYLDLGRFRNALVLAEQRAHQTPQLNEFVNTYGLWAYSPD